MQHANDFDQTRPNYAVVENVHWILDLRLRSFTTGVADVKTANTRQELSPISRQPACWISRRLPHCCRKHRPVAAPAVNPPPFGARREDVREVRPRQCGETKSRHRISARPCPMLPS